MISKNASNGAFRSKEGYTVVQNPVVRDRNLSLKAKGLYLTIQAYITMPDKEWKKSDFLGMVSEGEKAFNSAWAELKNAGYLKTHTYPCHGTWKHEYELLDRAEKGPHTFYYDAQGNLTKTNESMEKSLAKSPDESPAEAPEEHFSDQNDRPQHYPQKGSSAKGVCAEGCSANGGSNNKSLNTNPDYNSCNINPSIYPDNGKEKMDGPVDPNTEPVILDIYLPVDEAEEEKIREELEAERLIPAEWVSDPGKMTTAIQVLSGWNAKIIDYADDPLQLNAFGTVVKALTEMCTCKTVQTYGSSNVSYSHVLKQLNNLAHGEKGLWEIVSFISSCTGRLAEAEKSQTIKNPTAYAKSMIWNNFSTYRLDFEGFFHRTYYGSDC